VVMAKMCMFFECRCNSPIYVHITAPMLLSATSQQLRPSAPPSSPSIAVMLQQSKQDGRKVSLIDRDVPIYHSLVRTKHRHCCHLDSGSIRGSLSSEHFNCLGSTEETMK
jgi:hypothetical protein